MIKLLWPQSYLSMLIGAISALLGWQISQILLFLRWPLTLYPLLLFTLVCITLSLGLTTGAIFLNNPTRPRLAWIRLRPTLPTTSLTALLWGFGAGCTTLLILLPFLPLPAILLRVASWALVGGATGIAEAKAWEAQSLEAGDKAHARSRFQNSRAAGIAAGVAAGLLFELFRGFLRLSLAESETFALFQALEEPLGLGLFGATLGYFLSCTTSPTYRAALRAGAGFEFSSNPLDIQMGEPEQIDPEALPPYPHIRPQDLGIAKTATTQPSSTFHSFLYGVLPFLQPQPSSGVLKFVSRAGLIDRPSVSKDGQQERIEEGLSIQLPLEGRILIGSPDTIAAKTHIVLSGFPPNLATLEMTPNGAILTASRPYCPYLRRNGRPLNHTNPVPLRHNDILTFANPDPQKYHHGPSFYRFIYYNRFLDPQA